MQYQIAISILSLVSIVHGTFGLCRAVLVGNDSITLFSIGLMFAFACVAIEMIKRIPPTQDAWFRVKFSPKWHELSARQRCFMWWFDLPLHIRVREEELKRLYEQPMIFVSFFSESVMINPVESLHKEPYFLSAIVQSVRDCGLELRNLKHVVFGERLIGAEVQLVWHDSNRSIGEYLRREIPDQSTVALKKFVTTLEFGYARTLKGTEREMFFRGRR